MTDKVKEFWADKSNRISLLLAVGLLLFICHYQNQPFLEQVPLFQIGMVIIWFTVGYLILNRWKQVKETGLGPKYIWIPLAVISGSAFLRLIVQPDAPTLAGALLMASMFGLYVVSRQYGEKALSFFMMVTIIGAVSIIIQAIINKSLGGNPGIFNNYATAAHFLVFGLFVSPRKHQWWLAGIVLAGLFPLGADESVFYVAILGLMLLIRRDWSKKILLPVGVLVVLIIIGSYFYVVQEKTSSIIFRMNQIHTAVTDKSLTQEQKTVLLDDALDGRWSYGWRILRPITPLGYGVDITNHYQELPHNILLLVTDQLGPIAAAAWMACMIIGIKKTKWKYGFLALILFGVFQPFVWTEMAPYMWCMAGAATVSNRSSYIFKEA